MINRLARLITISFVLLIGMITSSWAGKLPLNIVVSFDGYHLIDDFPGGRIALHDRLQPVLADYILSKIDKVWARTEQPVENVLLINVEGSAYEQSPYIEMRFNEGNHELLEYQGAIAVGVPARGNSFAEKLSAVLVRAIRKNLGRMRAISEGIHSRWDFGDATNLQIERLMDDNARRTYSTRMAVLSLNTEPPGRVAADDEGLITQTLYLGPGDEVRGTLRPVRYDSVQTNVAMTARFCLKRLELLNEDRDPARVGYDCPIDGDCASDIIAPEGWALTQCATRQGILDHLQLGFLLPAYAVEQTELHWSVPPLEMLYRQSPDATPANTGFTDFTIETDAPLEVMADAVALEMWSNGTPIWLNSLPPENDLIAIDPEDGLLLRFGIQNLQLADRRDGCERLDARLVFYADGKPTGETAKLQRLYAPLRHPAERTLETSVGELTWWGRYRQPVGSKESGIFLLSKRFHPNKEGAREAALDALNLIREAFEAVNLSITAQELGGKVGLVGKPDIKANAKTTRLRLVGKIRPPRTVRDDGSVAFGLQLGLRAPSGLLQFTFDQTQTRELLDLLVAARGQNAGLKKFLPARRKDFYIYTYTEKRQIGPDWACDPNVGR
jgi:hypothetical protein